VPPVDSGVSFRIVRDCVGVAFMSKQSEIRILSVDDHPLFREGISAVIKNEPDMVLVAEATNGSEALERFREHQPDVTLIDVRLPDSSGIVAMSAILTEFPQARVILLSTYEGDIDLQSALQAGAWGHILKTMHPREMVNMIRQVYTGWRCVPPPSASNFGKHSKLEDLTSREVEVLGRAAIGNEVREFGQRLFNSETPVRGNLKQIMRRLGARHEASAINIATRRGLIRL
jgi:DNA-binding NarL/FixJ family response regulator